jgi:hypothetical protein
MDTVSAILLDALIILVVAPVPLVALSLRRHRTEQRDFEARVATVLSDIEDVLSEVRRERQAGPSRGRAPCRPVRTQAMAEHTRSGFVYVISNIGSFGQDVVKIGLTRRLDPVDRVRELGDASVPFAFEVHALIYSDDAPALERALHAAFDRVRVNTRNERKEFFRARLDDVEQAVRRLEPDAMFFRDFEARDYREALSRRQKTLARKAAATRAARHFGALKPGRAQPPRPADWIGYRFEFY